MAKACQFEEKIVLGLHPGETVKIRKESEIVYTLDENYALEGLPFMPEMRKYCGRRFEVLGRGDIMFAEGLGNRSIKNTVILEGATCDGTAHNDCKRTCFLLWKESWLKRIGEKSVAGSTSGYKKRKDVSLKNLSSDSSKNAIFPCQLVSLTAATRPLPISLEDFIRQYVCNSEFSRFTPVKALCQSFLWLNFKIQRALGRKKYATIRGTLRRTPTKSLNLRAWELVEVRDKDEIFSTLDHMGRNRGLSFTAEMLKFCGGRFRVLRRVDKMIVETGEMRPIANTVLLEGVHCDGGDHENCPRNCYCLWREIWLKRA